MTKNSTNSQNGNGRSDSNRQKITRLGRDSEGPSRRAFLKSSGALGIAGLLGVGGDAVGQTMGAATGSGDPWTLVAIPDTQNMINVDNWNSYAHSITDWIVDNAAEQNIAFVTHEGDMVFHGDEIGQWEEIDRVMSKLDGVVPWSPGVGNHDFQDTWDRSSGAENFKEYFGPSRFESRSYYGGSSPGGRSSYQYFSAGGYDFLHISLEWEAPGEPNDPSTPLGWAQQVLDENPDLPTIITTHSYLEDEPRRRRQNVQSGSRGNSGQDIWEKLVEPNPQVFMTLNGHAHQADDGEDGEYRQVSTNVAGEDVYEILANYQDYDNGGNGWFRRIRFIPGGGSDAPDRIEVRTYTAYHDEYQTSDRSEFAYDLDFDSRFDVSGSGGDRDTVTFQQGVAGYDGTADTQLHEGNPDVEYDTDTTLTIDGADDGGEVHGLLRFDDIIGSDAGQVPSGATVNAATLSFESTNPGDGASFHRMLAAWRDTDAWNDWGGIESDDVEAVASADATVSDPNRGTVTVDVTESVQAWADGKPNEGWALLPEGNNGWDFESAEGSTPPELSVVYEGGDGCDATKAVEFVSATETASGDEQFDVARPDGIQEGDVLLLTIAGTANGENGMPYDQTDRWTRIGICSQDRNDADRCIPDGQDLFLHIYYRVATANEPGDYTVNSDGNTVASVTAYRDVDVDAPIVSSTGLVNDGDYEVSTCPPTEGVDDGMLVCGITHDDQHDIENLGELTLRSEDQNPDSSTQVLTKSLGSDGMTDRHEVDHVDPTGNKDTSMAVVLRPAPADCDGGDNPAPTARIGTVEEDYENWIRLDASESSDPDGGSLSYQWDISSGEFYQSDSDTAERPWIDISGVDELTATLTVTDDEGQTANAERSFEFGAESGPGTNRLVFGETNELSRKDFLESSNGDYRFYFQGSDGNLVLRDTSTGDALWASNTAGDGGTELKLQGDGNLVLYTPDNDPVWASNTAGSGADELVLEDDGELALYDGETKVWSVNG